MIHSHPGTSWQWFQHTEGLGATLGAYLEQTGVSVAPAAQDLILPPLILTVTRHCHTPHTHIPTCSA